MHITFPTARPPTTERMTPQTLITRVCKTEQKAQRITRVRGRSAAPRGARLRLCHGTRRERPTARGHNSLGPAQHARKVLIPRAAAYLEADDVRDLHAVEIAFDLGNATAGCHGLWGSGKGFVAATDRTETGTALVTLSLSLKHRAHQHTLGKAQRQGQSLSTGSGGGLAPTAPPQTHSP